MSEQLPATIDRTKIIGDARAWRASIPLVLRSAPVSCLQPRRHRIHDLVRRQWVGAIASRFGPSLNAIAPFSPCGKNPKSLAPKAYAITRSDS
jgi:hypothetical protein